MENKEYKITFKKFFGHLHTVNKHRWKVFVLACKAGIPWRGFTHDLSKYSPVEFWPSVKYYQGGRRSPIPVERDEIGYSLAWLHHKGRNKHHAEYWLDMDAKERMPIIPYKYVVEMICDKLSASMTYLGKEWTNRSELDYWNEKERNRIPANEKIKELLDEVFIQVSNEGINKTINKNNLRRLYNKYCKNGDN